ncbi:DUF3010 family protein [Ferrovibrio sp. MS7]|uniref:DUF3010 family protein n=1 Tax=Ferrovibrio plantarum TaxID=3119164 RepID=UPI0031372921
MIVCGVELKGSEARLVLVSVNTDASPYHIGCNTKKLILGEDRNTDSIKTFLQAVKTFAHENRVDVFAIKSRAKAGAMSGGAISFKMETLFQLSDREIVFISPVTLAKFAKSNLGGIPTETLIYQKDAYLCGAYHLKKAGQL